VRPSAALCALALCGAAHAQLVDVDPDWKEAAAPPPPALNTSRLVPLEMRGTELRWGVDPSSISIGPDGVVRYVVVAQSDSGAVNAIYEGLRCNTAESTVYARHAGDQWVPAPDREWKPIHGSGARRHTLLIARGGACMGHAPNRSPEHIAIDLGKPADTRFRPELR